jgi:hypothetical protein
MLAYNNPAWKCEIRPMRMLLHQHEVRSLSIDDVFVLDTNFSE